jgi:hypothetical protein
MLALWASAQFFIAEKYSIASIIVCFIIAFLLGPRTKIIRNQSDKEIRVKWFVFKKPQFY